MLINCSDYRSNNFLENTFFGYKQTELNKLLSGGVQSIRGTYRCEIINGLLLMIFEKKCRLFDEILIKTLSRKSWQEPSQCCNYFKARLEQDLTLYTFSFQIRQIIVTNRQRTEPFLYIYYSCWIYGCFMQNR